MFSKKEKENIIRAIDTLTEMFEKESYSFIKPEYRRAFQIGQLDALLSFREVIEHNNEQ